MIRANAKRALFAVGLVLLPAFPACGKKAPLRPPDSRAAEHAPALRARVREGRVTLDFHVPAHRSFPEREDPWVLARILRQATPSPEVVEAGTMHNGDGFAFDSPLSWSDQELPPKTRIVYRVEFRDAIRRRRALSPPLAVSWEQSPGTPANLVAGDHLRSIVLDWKPPHDHATGLTYRVYRREVPHTVFEQITPEPVSGTNYIDSRIEAGRDYCYEIRAVLTARTLEVEGPACPESCSRSAPEAP